MMDPDPDRFQPRISLLDYLQQHGWKIVRDNGREEVAGLCPLHRESRPSFYVNRRKQVFYCHGCGRGGGLSRLIGWLEAAPQSPVGLPAGERLLERTYRFYQQELRRNETARAYLARRGIHNPAVVEQMRIGYAPGACLRSYLARFGYGRQALLERGLIDERGRDCFFRCLTFPLVEAGNLYGRSLGDGIGRHRFLPGCKGGLYGWTQTLGFPRVIVVEGMFDVAALWQATSGVQPANPHRFRHTLGSDMIRAGLSLPALQRLMGHAHIHTTLLYIQLTPQDVFAEYNRAVHQIAKLKQPPLA